MQIYVKSSKKITSYKVQYTMKNKTLKSVSFSWIHHVFFPTRISKPTIKKIPTAFPSHKVHHFLNFEHLYKFWFSTLLFSEFRHFWSIPECTEWNFVENPFKLVNWINSKGKTHAKTLVECVNIKDSNDLVKHVVCNTISLRLNWTFLLI